MRTSPFYPLTFFLMAAMVLYALKPGLDRMQEWRRVVAAAASEGLSFDGDMLEALVATDRVTIAFDGLGEERVAILGSSGVLGPDEAYGAHYFVPADAVRALGDLELQASFEVRSEPDSGAKLWLVRVVAPGVSDTGWIELPAEPEWTRQSVRLPAPRGDETESMDIIIWPDALGDGGRIEIRRIALDPLTPPR
jgi:hypothetical protein